MARPALRRVGTAGGGRPPRLAHLDRDRPLVEAAQRDPARFDALYRRYLAQVYSYAYYELARPSRRGGRHRADVPAGAGRTCTGSRSAPGRPTARAPRRSGSGCSRSPATSSPSAGGRRRRRPEAPLEDAAHVADRGRHRRGQVIGRDEAAAAWRAVGRPARRPPPGGRPALRGRADHRRDRGHPGPVARARSGSSSIARCEPWRATCARTASADERP